MTLFIVFILIMIGCVLIYSASPNQLMLSQPKGVWVRRLGILFLAVGFVVLCTTITTLSALFQWCMYSMLMLVLIPYLAAYIKAKRQIGK
jgi:cell division protein FtsW (lipid II flippase)